MPAVTGMNQQESIAPITLTLPYPISANRYWKSFPLGKRIMTAPSKEAMAYKTEVHWLCKQAGIRKPIIGRVRIDIQLFPHRPLDWQKRMRTDGDAWSDTVQCIDLDNANKVLLDSLKGIAIEDDKWVRKLASERMEPDEHGARVVICITPLLTKQPQALLFEPAALADFPRKVACQEPF